MPKKPFTAEEVSKLLKSPYIVSINSDQITYTQDFKRKAYAQLMNGLTMREIFEAHGISTEILGSSRIHGIAHKLREQGKRVEGFIDKRKQNSWKPARETRERTLEDRVEYLEHQLAYAQQEVEFLKKVRTADLEAQALWESRQRQK